MTSLHLLPRISANNGTDNGSVHSVAFRNPAVTQTSPCQFPYLSHFSLREFCVFVGRAVRWVIPAFGNRVLDVVTVSTQKKMIWVHAIRSITPMKNPKTIRNRAIVKNPGYSMGSPSLVINHDLAVTVLANVCCPQPAIALRSFSDFLPEEFLKTLVLIVPNLCHVNGNHE